MIIWYLISEEARQGLTQLFFELSGYPFIPPKEPIEPPVKFKYEGKEDIDRLMRQTRRHFR